MWGGSALRREYSARDEEFSRWPMHNIDQNLVQQVLAENQYGDSTSASYGTPVDGERSPPGGTWGERDVGGPISQKMAMEDFEQLRRELTALSRARSKSVSEKPDLFRTQSRRSAPRIRPTVSQHQSLAGRDEGLGDENPEAEEAEEFILDEFLREGHFEKRKGGESAKKVGVYWRNLTVKGLGSNTTFVKTLPDAVLGTFGPDLYKLITGWIPSLAFGHKATKRTLINDFTGLVRDGEMMLVLGRPGSGCTTFLKAIANSREEYAEVTGEVSYGGIDAETQKKHYRGEVNYNPEDDIHFPDLNVWQTFIFALINKTKKREKKDIPIIADALMRMFGISHTKYTKVGNEYVRGISGGERKRVSIAETLAAKSTVISWDNSTRGLDASTALDYARSLRVMTDISNRTTLVTLYQAGEGIYELMDKVLVIDGGRCVFCGPASEAKQYFIDMGFECPPRQTTPDYLTACTDPTERQNRKGFEGRVPRTSEELEKAFRESENYQRLLADVQQYEQYLQETDLADAKEFERTVRESKSHRTVPKSSSYTISYTRQVLACVERELWLLWGDKTTLYTKAFTIVANGLIVGSLFYGQSADTSGTFSRGGSVFFSILFLGWLQLSELMRAVTGRDVIARQNDYAFYKPSAVSLARVIVDFPVLLPQVLTFGILMYFMTGLTITAGRFFIYILFVFTTTICITALYRMFAAVSPTIDDAVRFSGIALNLLAIFTGYVIPKPQLTSQYIWFGWLYYVNPIAYSFEATLANEFSGRTMQCNTAQLVPQGPGVTAAHQGCALAGAAVNAHTVSGAAYIETNYTYTRAHLWRNFGIVIAWTVLYIAVTVLAIELFSFAKSGGGVILFKKSKRAKKMVEQTEKAQMDEETAGRSASSEGTAVEGGSAANADEGALKDISGGESVFTWEDVCYTVPYQGGERQLLNHVNGYAKPGVMIALMGASGAGKSTLLNTLSQRQTMGVVSGDMLVDGRELGVEFKRGTGFCEQMDLHDGTATIREALEFSAILRQDRSVPKSEKIAYVDKIVDLLELQDLQDAIISSLGVEQRKRLTIGVELAAKPSLLLFLDEPTSGLDSQSAMSIIRFLKKLCAAGQAIVCTIHQPSSVLIQQFDMILALNPGGNTFYFGPVGENGSDVIKYFGERGFDCPPAKNVAEFILEIAAKSRRRPDGTKIDWNEEWRNSENAKQVKQEIARVKAERGKVEPPKADTQHEFAAPVWTQTLELTKRTFRQHWRDPSYYYGKLFVAVIVAIFNGFTFWQLGYSIQDMQDRLFSAFLIVTIPPTVVNAVLPKFFQNMQLWQARELPSRIYSWFAFCTANVITELPIGVVQAALYFVLWYFPAGLPTDSPTAGYVFFMTLLIFWFMSSWGQWICAFAPSFTVIANILPFFFVMFGLFNGVVVPYSNLPVFWKYWMYWVNPCTWWIRGILSATLSNQPIRCALKETASFTPPPGESCSSYAGAFAKSAGGYLLDPAATDVCHYCQYTSANQYLATLSISPTEKWRDLGIFLVFVVSNWALVYFFIYTVRIRGWSFGFGAVTGVVGKLGKMVGKPFEKAEEKRRAKEERDVERQAVEEGEHSAKVETDGDGEKERNV